MDIVTFFHLSTHPMDIVFLPFHLDLDSLTQPVKFLRGYVGCVAKGFSYGNKKVIVFSQYFFCHTLLYFCVMCLALTLLFPSEFNQKVYLTISSCCFIPWYTMEFIYFLSFVRIYRFPLKRR